MLRCFFARLTHALPIRVLPAKIVYNSGNPFAANAPVCFYASLRNSAFMRKLATYAYDLIRALQTATHHEL